MVVVWFILTMVCGTWIYFTGKGEKRLAKILSWRILLSSLVAFGLLVLAYLANNIQGV